MYFSKSVIEIEHYLSIFNFLSRRGDLNARRCCVISKES